MAKADRTAAITPKCQRVADEMGFELVEVALDREPTGLYLRIYIEDGPGLRAEHRRRGGGPAVQAHGRDETDHRYAGGL